jgi:hypothetical protein
MPNIPIGLPDLYTSFECDRASEKLRLGSILLFSSMIADKLQWF